MADTDAVFQMAAAYAMIGFTAPIYTREFWRWLPRLYLPAFSRLPVSLWFSPGLLGCVNQFPVKRLLILLGVLVVIPFEGSKFPSLRTVEDIGHFDVDISARLPTLFGRMEGKFKCMINNTQSIMNAEDNVDINKPLLGRLFNLVYKYPIQEEAKLLSF
ncbi:MAG: hypothetical protein MJA29_04015 [Candidatus Omnitrophica bacterium]|nr:hypothetical protein [Candidatus Omnitrophota bacterium]